MCILNIVKDILIVFISLFVLAYVVVCTVCFLFLKSPAREWTFEV